MSAPAGWQKGSFRGVPFRTEEQETTGGRRGALHEFPQADKPVWEDLGRGARHYHIDCHITGTDYPAGADALADALDEAGAGTLVHPWLGAMQVAVPEGGWSRRDSTIDGGIAWFSIDFVESGLPVPATATTDTQALAQAAADDAAAAVPESMADGFSLEGATAFVEEAADSLAKGLASAVAIQAGLQGGIGSALSALESQIGLLGDAGALLRDPLALGTEIVGLVQMVGTVARGMGAADGGAASFRALMGWGADLPEVPGDTPARASQRANQAAMVQAVNLAASSELVRALAATDYASWNEAMAARDDAADRIDALALRQADAGDDAGTASYDALRQAAIVDLTARGGPLARMRSHVPAITEPALAIAQRLYGDPSTLEARTADIVARNRVRHPGFVPGGVALDVLEAEASNG